MFTGQIFSGEKGVHVLLIGLTPFNLRKIKDNEPAFLRPGKHVTPPGWSVVLMTGDTFAKWVASGEIVIPKHFSVVDTKDKPIIATADVPSGARVLMLGLTKDMMGKLDEGGAIEVAGGDARMPVGWEFFIFTGESEIAISQNLEKHGYIDGKTVSKFDPRLFKS